LNFPVESIMMMTASSSSPLDGATNASVLLDGARNPGHPPAGVSHFWTDVSLEHSQNESP
jgi:hypothetical protein